MPIQSFLLMALTCAVQTLFLTHALANGQVFLVIFWGLLLGRNLVKTYLIQRFNRLLLPPKK